MGRVWLFLAIAAVYVLSGRSKDKKRKKQRAAAALKARPAAPVPEAPEVPEEPEEPPKAGLCEGESRQCAHGLAAGSIQEDTHEGEPAPQPLAREPLAAVTTPAQRPRLDARELRRAVVTAEILKRPCERGRRFL